jgi:Repeat of unknown function (DUF346)
MADVSTSHLVPCIIPLGRWGKMKRRLSPAGLVTLILLVMSAVLISATPAAADTSVENLGGFLQGKPGAVSWAPGRLDVFVRGSDNQLWHRFYQGGWSLWEPLGGVLTSDPAAVSWAPGRLDVFARGSDNQLWHRFYQGGWSLWEPLGGVLNSAPAVATWAPGRLDVFVQGSHNEIEHRFFEGVWSGWESLGGASPDTFGPTAVAWSFGRIDVFITGTDFQLWHLFYQGGWSRWEPLGGHLVDDPDVSSAGSGNLEVTVIGDNDVVYLKSFDLGLGWDDFQSLGGTAGSAVEVVIQPDQVDLFFRDDGSTTGTANVLVHIIST